MSGDITDVPGVRVGHWSDVTARTGCTVVRLPDEGAVTSVDVRGAAPGTRETDVLAPDNQVQVAHAILLTGGSAFGLAAADGVMTALEAQGVGVPTPVGVVPIVPAAVLYDLAAGRADVRPGAAEGLAALEAATAGQPCGAGIVGAGTGATVGKLFGDPVPGGLGTASVALPGGGVVGAVVAVNAVGDVVDRDGALLAGAGTVERLLLEVPPAPPVGSATTIAVVATDLALTKTQAHRLAVVAHDGLAQAIRPVHTAYDGDTVFATSTGLVTPADPSLLTLQTAAVVAVAAAVRRAVQPH
ncbi:P1 family peptidase [Nocardioides marmoribigeumensis]|uniref:L-aminopeptidase/D-esterase-like protein n=1 Tax=Nocardioides marmoribigeumensis TaxID=433649 RepID=A0ABU2BTC6_9ACTN|nr:P1 family peptidase [Nocardioides marmoribigeumensis]MDR7361526.1 L-aminopeptidase/D-esterase-like protein [Nocardioides marmoribigeumensis]